MKTIPTDYDQKLTLEDVKNLNLYKFAKRMVELQGFYSCVLDNKKTVITL